MKKIANFLFYIYQIVVKTIITFLGVRTQDTCKFHPSCSVYTRESLKKYGFLKGSVKSFRRILRCHPWSSGGVDLP